MAAIVVCCLALTVAASNVDHYTFVQTMKVEFELMERLRFQANQGGSQIPRTDWHFITDFLEPLIERQRGREGGLLDPIYALSVASAADFYTSHVPHIPDVFESLWQAREILEVMLNWITYTVKIRHSRGRRDP